MATTLQEYLDLEIDTLQELLSSIPFKPSAEDTIGTPTLGGISLNTQPSIIDDDSLGQLPLDSNGTGNSNSNKHEETIFMNLYKLRRDELVNILNNSENTLGIDSNKMLKLGISFGNLIKNSQIDERPGTRVISQPSGITANTSNDGNTFMNRIQSLNDGNGSATTLGGGEQDPAPEIDNPFMSKPPVSSQPVQNRSTLQQTVQQVKFLRNLLTLLKNFDVGSSSLYNKRSSHNPHNTNNNNHNNNNHNNNNHNANGSAGGHRGVSSSSVLSGNSANNNTANGGYRRGSDMYNYDSQNEYSGTSSDCHSGIGGNPMYNRDSANYGVPTGSASINGSTHTGGLATSSVVSSSPIKLTSKQLLIEKLEININLDLLFIYQVLFKLILRIYEIMKQGILQHQIPTLGNLERGTLNGSDTVKPPSSLISDFNFSMNITMNHTLTTTNDSSSIFSSNSAASSDSSSLCTPDEYVRLIKQVTDRISFGIIGPFVNIIVSEIVEPNINQGFHDVMVSL
ncbi:uncharacterized protein KQ657_003201 [Scheffersomyces spartinae]|uniref:Uncharacterized protein n=1 Tax=Scheffersomyces spartinae TaxID=45513 RepID=A0A9P7VCS5_9ASCO|nr:uncharacterized protein KQ657_003201 [Scheffersomyces spartinae]KAG7195440.1 hypothetical protein KQ657_003201 [Scheffersomyces spartinae]